MNAVLLTDVVHKSPTKVIRGERLDSDCATWIQIENQVVPEDTTLRAGSIVEKADPQVKLGIKFGWYAEVGKLPHTNLEAVFAASVPFMGKSNQAALADVLRSYRINSLEQVAENAEGREPFTDGKKKGGMPIRVKEVLLRHGSTDITQVETWMAMAKETIAKES